ncbi:MAG TPA: penicillin-binding transpeptidase domain-containing protein, partial [Sandaracinaceae bacterium]
IYLEVGAERVRAGLERLGLGRGPTLGVEGAEGGALPPLEAWNGFAGVTYAMGTALTATPLELTSAYAAIANDGVRIEPTLDGVAGAETRVLSAATARRVREMLVHAVEDEGATGRNARVSGLQVAGKTGTAMVEDDGVRALFVGIVPADAPRYVIYVDAEIGEDRPGFHGGSVAAPAFARIAARIAER